MDPVTSIPARIGLWGTFDIESFGDALAPSVVRAELARRLPAAEIRHFAPLGSRHPNRFDGGAPAEPLGPYTAERVAELAEELDCVVAGPVRLSGRDGELAPWYGLAEEELRRLAPSRFFVEGLGPDLERECPVIWNAVEIPVDVPTDQAAVYRAALEGRPYVSVRDGISRDRLVAAGIEREVAVVPDPLVLVPDLFAPDLLEQRLEYLRVTDRFPRRGPAVVLQGDRRLVPFATEVAAAADRLAAEYDGAALVLAETGTIPGDADFAAAMAESLAAPSYRLGPATVEDLVAVLASAAGFVGTSLHAGVVAFAYARPYLALEIEPSSELRGFSALIDDPDCLVRVPDDIPSAFEKAMSRSRGEARHRLRTEALAHFDRLAEIAARAAGRRAPVRAAAGLAENPADLRRRVEVLRRALEARGRLLVEQRWTFADRVQDAEAREQATRQTLEAEVARLEAEVARLEAEVEGKAEELRTVLNTRTFRYTAALRRIWGWLRSRLRR